MVLSRFDVYLVNLDPTLGSEIQRHAPASWFRPTR
jgi:hypothetical protein